MNVEHYIKKLKFNLILKKKNQRKGCGCGLLYYSKIFTVKYGNYLQFWANAKQIQDISKLTNLIPKRKHCVTLFSILLSCSPFSLSWT